MSVDDELRLALASLPAKPADEAPASDKKRYSELMSQGFALCLAADMRRRGMAGTQPAEGPAGVAGAERRMSGGIGAKQVDVTWATEESGLLLAASVKTINFRDSRSGNYQKNLANRRGDMLFEAVTLHRRFPFAVLGGFLVLDEGARHDATPRRRSTFDNAHRLLRMFTGRADPAGREEQYEALFVVLVNPGEVPPFTQVYLVGQPEREVGLAGAVDRLAELAGERNPDFYEAEAGLVRTARS